jgi:phage regulator Rha-like protein
MGFEQAVVDKFNEIEERLKAIEKAEADHLIGHVAKELAEGESAGQ